MFNFSPTLVPGTGGTAASDYDNNYLLLLGKNTGVAGGGLGYDVCSVSPPPNMLGDIQVASEYIAFALNLISTASVRNGGPSAFPVTSWSQGGRKFVLSDESIFNRLTKHTCIALQSP